MTRWTLDTMKNEVEDRLKAESLSDAQIYRWLNDAQDRLFREIDFDHKNRPISFATVASTREYYVKCAYRRIKSVVDQTDNNVLEEVSVKDIELWDPDQDDSGSPLRYAVEGLYEVKAQPSSASKITVVSSSASDTSETVRLVGEDASGNLIQEQVTLNGTTNVTSSNTYTKLNRVRKSANTVGFITISAGSTTLAIIDMHDVRSQYVRLIMDPTPDGANTINLYALHLPWPMEYVEDVPDLPEEWWSLLLEMAIEYGHRWLYEFEAAEAIAVRNEREIAKLKAQQGNSRNQKRRRRARNLKAGVKTAYPWEIG